MDTVTRCDLVDSVRRALPGIDAVNGLRAVRTLALIRSHPDRVQARADFLAIPSNGDMDAFTSSPDPYTARRHEMNADDTEVRRFGLARVQGSTVPEQMPPNGSAHLLMTMLDDLAVRYDSETDTIVPDRTTVGVSVYKVRALTDLFYGGHIPPMIGGETIQKAQMIHVAQGTDPASCRVAVGQDATASKRPSWPTRGLASTYGPTSPLGAIKLRASEYCPPGAVPAPCDDTDHLFIGHNRVPRGKLAKSGKSAKAKASAAENAARDIGTVTAETPEAIAMQAECMNRDERVYVIVNGVRLTLTRGKSDAGTWALKPPNGKASGGLRSPAQVATKALKLASA